MFINVWDYEVLSSNARKTDQGLSLSERDAPLTVTDDEDSYDECKMFGITLHAQALVRISLALQWSQGQAEKIIFITAISPMLIKPITWVIMAFWLHAAESCTI